MSSHIGTCFLCPEEVILADAKSYAMLSKNVLTLTKRVPGTHWTVFSKAHSSHMFLPSCHASLVRTVYNSVNDSMLTICSNMTDQGYTKFFNQQNL